jgi:hypothetical protein
MTSHCNRCLRATKHRVIKRVERPVEDGKIELFDLMNGSDEPHRFQEARHQFDIVECCGCGEVHFVSRVVWEWAEDPQPDAIDEMLTERHFPARVDRPQPAWLAELERRSVPNILAELAIQSDQRNDPVPAAIVDLLREVYQAYHAECPRLAVMGIRALVDVVCADKIGDCGGFDRKLDALVKGEFISSRDSDILKAAVELGHAVAHRGYRPATGDVCSALDIVENMLRSMYHAPGVAQKLSERTPQRKRNDGDERQ